MHSGRSLVHQAPLAWNHSTIHTAKDATQLSQSIQKHAPIHPARHPCVFNHPHLSSLYLLQNSWRPSLNVNLYEIDTHPCICLLAVCQVLFSCVRARILFTAARPKKHPDKAWSANGYIWWPAVPGTGICWWMFGRWQEHIGGAQHRWCCCVPFYQLVDMACATNDQWVAFYTEVYTSSFAQKEVMYQLQCFFTHRKQPKNMILAGLWCSTEKPPMRMFLKPIIEMPAKLESEGTHWVT